MPALAPYIPPTDADLNNWAANFGTLTTATPATYGLTPTDATNIANAIAVWAAAYLLCTSASTKTAQAVSDKNTAKITMLAVVRPYAQQISNNPGVSSANKIALGLNPKTSTPVKITPPDSNPVLSVQSAQNLAIILRYRDSISSPSVKAKPFGVVGCQIFGKVSATAIIDPGEMFLLQVASKSPVIITFDPTDGGKQAYFAARWAIQTGGLSPWSPVVSFTVPSGSAAPGP